MIIYGKSSSTAGTRAKSVGNKNIQQKVEQFLSLSDLDAQCTTECGGVQDLTAAVLSKGSFGWSPKVP